VFSRAANCHFVEGQYCCLLCEGGGMWRCLSDRVSVSGYLLIECGGIAAMQMRSSQLDSNDLDLASRDWLGGCLTSAAG